MAVTSRKTYCWTACHKVDKWLGQGRWALVDASGAGPYTLEPMGEAYAQQWTSPGWDDNENRIALFCIITTARAEVARNFIFSVAMNFRKVTPGSIRYHKTYRTVLANPPAKRGEYGSYIQQWIFMADMVSISMKSTPSLGLSSS